MTPDTSEAMTMGAGSSSSSSSGTSSTMMIFQSSTMTPLYSAAWTPTTQGQYAGTCIFIIALAVLFRIMVAGKILQEARWLEREKTRTYKIRSAAGSASTLKSDSKDGSDDKEGRSTVPTKPQDSVMMPADAAAAAAVQGGQRPLRPWRLSVDPLRAAMDTILAGVGYLLMLAVMTMNVGYFISVLGGVFIGSLIVGRYTFGVHAGMVH